jgi:hypothetical protein
VINDPVREESRHGPASGSAEGRGVGAAASPLRGGRAFSGRVLSARGVSVSSFQYWQRKLRDAAADHGGPSLAPPALARFDPVEVVSRQAVTIRFGGGTVMEIPEDRVDLVCAAIEALAGEREPC